MTTETLTMPARWAPYLINGDESDLEDDERERIDAYLEKVGVGSVLDCADEVRFTWAFELYGGDAVGGDVVDYTVTAR